MVYLRPRSDSDPTTPFYTPLISKEKQIQNKSTRGYKMSPAIREEAGRGVWVPKGEGDGYGALNTSGEFGPESL